MGEMVSITRLFKSFNILVAPCSSMYCLILWPPDPITYSPSSVLYGGGISSLDGLVMLYSMQFRVLLVLAPRSCWWLLAILSSRTTVAFPDTLLQLFGHQTAAWEYLSPNTGIFISLCWISLHSCWPISLYNPSEWQYSRSISQFSSFVPFAILLIGAISRSFIKIFNSIYSIIQPWHYPVTTQLVTGFWLDFVPLITTLWVQQLRHYLVHLTVCLFSPCFHQFVNEDVMGDSVESFTKVKISKIYYLPTSKPMFSV